MDRLRTLLFAAALCVSAAAVAQGDYDETMCGPLANGFGPFDYRRATTEQKGLVEGAHFTSEIEGLKGRQRFADEARTPPGSDIDYTLRVFPNHARALYAALRLEEQNQLRKPKGLFWPVPCYFARAIAFTPDDPNVRLVYGIYLMRRGAKDEALKQLEAAHGKVGDDMNLNYNLGLAYFDAGKYDRALDLAKKAYALGFPLDGLKNKLKKAGKWQD